MEIVHHDLRIELPDGWWAEAGMADFRPCGDAYRAANDAVPERRLFVVRIEDISPVRRGTGVGIFNDCRETGRTARERVVSILRGFRAGASLPPVEVVRTPADRLPCKLKDGTHRLYCSLAAGFSHVPAVDTDALYCG